MTEFFCSLCPRNCLVDRNKSKGFCGANNNIVLAKIMLHNWEEPCICFGKGSGALFFSGCQLKCIFCQNHEISSKIQGHIISAEKLYSLFFRLEEEGACNINLISPTPYLNKIISVLKEAKKDGLSIPIVMNSGGYESVETLKKLEGLIDIYLPDFKFFDPALSKALANAEDYPIKCINALKEMVRQKEKLVWDNEKLKSGVIIRHLILPGKTEDSLNILKEIEKNFSKDQVILSLLRQYTPCYKAKDFPELSRPLTRLEYQKVTRFAEKIGFEYLYTQQKESASDFYIPNFNVFSEERIDKEKN